MHYAGHACEMDSIIKVARKYSLIVIEDAAQAIMSKYRDKYLGSIGDIGCFSFHETKNIISGEGGAILINNPIFSERAEIIREKGTNRNLFCVGRLTSIRGLMLVLHLPGEPCLFFWLNFEHGERIISKRKFIWDQYYVGLSESKGL